MVFKHGRGPEVEAVEVDAGEVETVEVDAGSLGPEGEGPRVIAGVVGEVVVAVIGDSGILDVDGEVRVAEVRVVGVANGLKEFRVEVGLGRKSPKVRSWGLGLPPLRLAGVMKPSPSMQSTQKQTSSASSTLVTEPLASS